MDDLTNMYLASVISDLLDVLTEVQEITGYRLSDGQEARYNSGVYAVDKYLPPDE